MTHLINELLMKEIWVRENLIKIFVWKETLSEQENIFCLINSHYGYWTASGENLGSINFDNRPGHHWVTSHHQASEYILQDMNEAKFYKSKKRSITKIYRPDLIIQITTWVSPLPFEKYEKRMLAKLFYQHGKMLANMFNFTSDCQDVFQIYRKIFHSRNC